MRSDKKIVILSSMSAAFSALFGTPMAAVIFPLEVISVGILYYGALVPCVFSAFTAQHVALCLKVRTLELPYPVNKVPRFYNINALKCILLALACAAAGALFCIMLHKCEHYFEKWIANLYIRVVSGALAVIALYFIVGTDAYLGLGSETIHASFEEPAGIEMFLLKWYLPVSLFVQVLKAGRLYRRSLSGQRSARHYRQRCIFRRISVRPAVW